MEHGLIIFVCLFLGAVGFSALILWMSEQEGLLGQAGKAMLMAFMAVAGVVCLLVGIGSLIVYRTEYLSPDFGLKFFAIMLLWPGLQLVWGFGKRFIDPGPGIEKQEVDLQSRELVKGVKRARDILPSFIEKVRGHIDGAYIRFPLVTDKKVTEHVWGYVRHYENGMFNVSPVKEPYAREREFSKRIDIQESTVEDWQIIEADGLIKGAYTYIGAFQYFENNGLKFNRTMRKQRSLFVDAGQALS